MSNMPDKEDQYYRKALSLEPDKAPRLNSLAYFLIDKERNIDEGMALVEKVLRSDPNNYNSMHIKGYALYKQGKYHQALDLMQLSWNLRMQQSIYNHRCYLQLEETRNAVNKL
jgi:tetratricopeptide (TPR) repeat protein